MNDDIDIPAVYLERGSRYFECPDCAELAHVSPSAPSDFLPVHTAGSECGGKFVKRSRGEWLQTHNEQMGEVDSTPSFLELTPTDELPADEYNGSRVTPGEPMTEHENE